MINYTDRKIVQEQMQPGDYKVAATIYEKIASRPISEAMLYMFITGKKPCTGSRPGSHQPESMYRAICQAIQQRLAKQKGIDTLAASIRASTIEAAQAAGIV